MSVAVLCPTRSRPGQFSELVRSVAETSSAQVIAYVDEDQREMYRGLQSERCILHVGPQVGPVASANALVTAYSDHEAYGLITDDSTVIIPGWDQWLMESLTAFPNRIAVVSPYHNHGNHVDMPFVSKEWIEVVGWYAYPKAFHYCWPIITGLIGEMSAIVHAPMQRFAIQHEFAEWGNPDHRTSDAQAFFEFVSLSLPKTVERVRQAMS